MDSMGVMYRGDNIFISILQITPGVLKASSFSHEFHHVGMQYWWEQHPLVQNYIETKDTQEYWLLRLFEYLVSEGLANAYCSPGVIEKIDGDSDRIAAHNAVIEEYENRWDEFHGMVESLVEDISNNKLDTMKEKYELFTLDMSGRGKPMGHFFSGRMIREMDESKKVLREEIIELVKEPFSFFHLYNKAAKDSNIREFTSYNIASLDSFIDRMYE
jgi:hypothetical protein